MAELKQIINKKMYNTETAKYIDCYSNHRALNDFNYVLEELYLKKNGEFFLYKEFYAYGEGGGFRRSIFPLTVDEAKFWVENKSTVDIYIELFGEPEE